MTTDTDTHEMQPLPFTLDKGISHRASIGLIVLATDQTIEYEWRKWMDIDGVALYESRITNDREITPEKLRLMEPLIAPGAEVIMPGMDLDVIAFGCTSATMVLGEKTVFAKIKEVRPNVKCTTPLTAVEAALKIMKASKIALLTPYVKSVNDALSEDLAKRGFTVVRMGSFLNSNDNEVARIDEASIRNAVVGLGKHDDVDAVFVSCTSLRMVNAVASIEKEIGVPVTSSNHAMAWHALRLAGIEDKLPQFGQLFTL